MKRREFLGTAALAAGSLMVSTKAQAPFGRGALLHLGANMWDDFPGDPNALAASPEELKTKPAPIKPTGPESAYRNFVICRDDLWKQSIDRLAEKKMNLVFIDHDKAGFDLLACTSNWSCPEAAEAMVKFCKERLNPQHLKGIYTAPWKMTVPDTKTVKGISATLEGIDLFAAALDKHYKN